MHPTSNCNRFTSHFFYVNLGLIFHALIFSYFFSITIFKQTKQIPKLPIKSQSKHCKLVGDEFVAQDIVVLDGIRSDKDGGQGMPQHHLTVCVWGKKLR